MSLTDKRILTQIFITIKQDGGMLGSLGNLGASVFGSGMASSGGVDAPSSSSSSGGMATGPSEFATEKPAFQVLLLLWQVKFFVIDVMFVFALYSIFRQVQVISDSKIVRSICFQQIIWSSHSENSTMV